MSLGNTQLRIISALVLVAMVAVALSLGVDTSLGFVGLIGVLVVDEVIVNFLNFKRNHISYLISVVSFGIGFIYFNYIDFSMGFVDAFNNAGLLLCILLLIYLFLTPHESKIILKFLNSYTFLVGLLLLIPFMNLAAVIQLESWIKMLTGLIILNFGVDTAAWFWGKNFGKNKLWPAVSPKKTIEGFIGGVLSSVIVTAMYWSIVVGNMSYQLIISFFTIACCAQLGDLVQSKMKRQFEIKDSSNLIPGHGGVYDRVDSLLFVSPLYLWVMLNFAG